MKVNIKTYLTKNAAWNDNLAGGLFHLIAGHYRAPTHLKPRSPEEVNPPCFVVEDDKGRLVGVTFFKPITGHLVETYSTVIAKDWRGNGIGTKLNDYIEEELRKHGYGKITCNVYTSNLPSLVLKLKRGYLIEGTLMDHDFKGMHEYVLGKKL